MDAVNKAMVKVMPEQNWMTRTYVLDWRLGKRSASLFTSIITHSFIHSLTHSLTHSFIHPFTHSLFTSIIHSFTYSFTHSFTRPAEKKYIADQTFRMASASIELMLLPMSLLELRRGLKGILPIFLMLQYLMLRVTISQEVAVGHDNFIHSFFLSYFHNHHFIINIMSLWLLYQ